MFTNDGSNFLNKFGGGFGPCVRGDPTWPPWLYLKQLALAGFQLLIEALTSWLTMDSKGFKHPRLC